MRLLAAVMVFFPVFVYTRSGLHGRRRPPVLDVVDSLGGSANAPVPPASCVPAAVPHMASGVRIAAGSAVIAAVVGESLIGRKGSASSSRYAYHLLDLPRAFGAALVIVVVSVAGVRGRRASSSAPSTPGGADEHRRRHVQARPPE